MSKELLDFMIWVNQDKKLGYTSIGIERIVNKYIASKETYSIPIYENGIKTEWTIDGIIGDEKYQQLIEMTPEKKLPNMVNVNLKQNEEE